MYEEHLRLAFQTGNFLWERLRIMLPKKKKQCAPAPCKVTLLGDATVPPEVKKVLEHGPKLCTQPRLNPIEKIALVRSLADHVVPEEKGRCLSEAVDALRLRTAVQRSGPRISCVVSYLQENNLKLLTGDKEGGFVVLPQALYDEKSSKDITKNFRHVDVSLQKIKKGSGDL
ncbi:hypothetical protein HPB47_011028 [Ixodes persulcatus]|uniref:Uncharacterized protein n=1 Tax=Ixodes persulcatus TaxID=34615 RepID=A0AC60NXG2_IXOPE|nr:hypothetical protein HPB47_011028 [Ixodes persulcatus]